MKRSSRFLFSTVGWEEKLPPFSISTQHGGVEEEGFSPFSTEHGRVEEERFSPCQVEEEEGFSPFLLGTTEQKGGVFPLLYSARANRRGGVFPFFTRHD